MIRHWIPKPLVVSWGKYLLHYVDYWLFHPVGFGGGVPISDNSREEVVQQCST